MWMIPQITGSRILGETLEEQERNLRLLFDQLRKHELKAHPEKCEFFKEEMTFLGHRLTKDGVKPNPELVSKIKNMKIPTTVKQVKSFVACVNYYRKFIPNFSTHAKPLNALLKKNVTFKWDNKCQYSFEKLIDFITSEPILQYPDYNKRFSITCDGSKTAIGCVLAQDAHGKDLPIVYASRQLNKAEQAYPVWEIELLAIIFGIKQFHCYLYGKEFDIYSDHRPLTYL